MKPLPYSLAALALLLAGTTAHAQDVTNNGSVITVPSGALLTVPGSISNLNGSNFTAEGTVRVGGNLSNAGTLTSAGGTIILNGTTDQTLTPGTATLANIVVNNTGSIGQNRILLPADLTVTQQVTMTNGMLRTAPTATLRLPTGATLTGEATGRYVQGNLQVTRTPATSGSVDFGNGVVLAANGNTLGTVRVTRAAGLHQAGLTYGQNPANASQQGIDRVWTIVPDQQPTTPATLTFSWLPDDDNGISSFAQAQVWRMPDNQTAWQKAGPQANANSRSITASTTAFSRWTVSNNANPLPVELLRFTAERNGSDGLLRWVTASEKNNDWFEIESSLDGKTFQALSTVAGHGTTNQPSEYQYVDANLARYAAIQVYYRLRQIDHDGTENYSPVRLLQVPAPAGFAVQAWPNPSTDDVALSIATPLAGPATMQLIDALGRQVMQQQMHLQSGLSTFDLPDAHALAQGVYVLRVQQAGQLQTLRLVRK